MAIAGKFKNAIFIEPSQPQWFAGKKERITMKRLLISSTLVLSFIVLSSTVAGCSQQVESQALTGSQQHQSYDNDVFTRDDNTF